MLWTIEKWGEVTGFKPGELVPRYNIRPFKDVFHVKFEGRDYILRWYDDVGRGQKTLRVYKPSPSWRASWRASSGTVIRMAEAWRLHDSTFFSPVDGETFLRLLCSQAGRLGATGAEILGMVQASRSMNPDDMMEWLRFNRYHKKGARTLHLANGNLALSTMGVGLPGIMASIYALANLVENPIDTINDEVIKLIDDLSGALGVSPEEIKSLRARLFRLHHLGSRWVTESTVRESLKDNLLKVLPPKIHKKVTHHLS